MDWINKKQQLQSMQAMNSSSSDIWIDDNSLTYNVENEQSCRTIINLLLQGQIQHFKLEASFRQEYQLDEFEKEWRLQSEPVEAKEYQGLKGMQTHKLQRPPDYPKESIMELGKEPIRGNVFMDVYKEELDQMKEEYQIKISSNGYRLYIFTREGQDLNIICKNKLLDMSHKLQLFYGHEPNLILILNVSYLLRKKLNEKGVNVWFKKLYGRYMGVFFSINLTIPDMIAAIQGVTQFDISIFNIYHPTITETEAMLMKAVIQEALKDEIKGIEEQYEIHLQFSEDNNFIVFHSKHTIFGEQPIRIFKERLNSLIILSVKSRHIKDFDNKLRKLIKQSSFVSEVMNKRRNETFIAIDICKIYKNLSKNINKQVEQFLKLFLILIEPNFQLKIFFNHVTGSFEQLINHVINISEQNNMVLLNDELHNGTQKKAILKLKDFSECILNKRQKELLLFLQGLISPTNSKLDQSKSFIDESSLDNLSSYQHQVSRSSILPAEQKYLNPWLKISYSPPVQRDFGEEEDRDFQKDRRNRVLEGQFNAQSAFKFKVWSIQINKRLAIPEDNIVNHPYLLKSMFLGHKIKDSYDLSQLHSYKLKQEGAIGFLTAEIAIPFVPLFIFERIQ